LCLVIVRSNAGKTGAITLKAQSDGLESAAVGILTNPGNYPIGSPDLVPVKPAIDPLK
jgi:hypothetical protein